MGKEKQDREKNRKMIRHEDKIEDIKCSGRFKNQCKDLGVETISELLRYQKHEIGRFAGIGNGFFKELGKLKMQMEVDSNILLWNGFERKTWSYRDHLGGDYDYWILRGKDWTIKYDVMCDRNELTIQFNDGYFPVIDNLKIDNMGDLQTAIDLCKIKLKMEIL